MWISKEKHEALTTRIERLEEKTRDLERQKNELYLDKALILQHLKMAIIEEPSIPSKRVIISEKEAKKRKPAPINPLQQFFDSQRRGMAQGSSLYASYSGTFL